MWYIIAWTIVTMWLLSKFTHKNIDLVYFIALEPDSTFE